MGKNCKFLLGDLIIKAYYRCYSFVRFYSAGRQLARWPQYRRCLMKSSPLISQNHLVLKKHR
ncbi:hypothetical protein HanRHA438_Chr13g0579051 [Helianthus annuus]|uniref:Uncharacterized protein n=1 Tax=Helianthus annuus TaxID=4232 RepID=A0A251SMR1_HELAN|nr:hypothetical protein HanXRQr2_Chr13g0567291 [Helianthus annuus]KAJ0479269.1 hypothetical protein HanIR_Chr13g0618121 [Helianthus annuus]KAJ0847549.1 hypothetical protein HanPSC8_Chr13g0546511 [Helianthus annuus]KAJ0856494.1 hypothetical protein HanRHA438_Chr13g0579051 [Helianthus annuus]